ncbi:MAG: sugar ABC transporter ATP-binding protein [Beutenbergiaceae bacterium]
MNAATEPTSTAPVIELAGIAKNFAGVQALTSVDFDLYPGQINALLGENGAGKSTLIKIIAGAHQPTAGTMALDGEPVRFQSPHQALEAGVAVVYQETSLAPDLSVLENLYLGSWRTRTGSISWGEMRAEASELFRTLGMDIPLGSRLGALGKATAQQVEIARALLRGARILILDEPGSVLNDNELRSLHSLLLDSKRSGVAVVYITHRLEEVFRLADRITVLRDGVSAAVADTGEVDEAWVVRQMVGREVTDLYSRTKVEIGEPLLQVQGLADGGAFTDIDLTVHAGEIVGIAGLVGAGRTELAQAIAGMTNTRTGQIRLAGAELPRHPWDRQQAGIGYLPGDRSGQGVLSFRSNTANLTLTTLRRYARAGLMNRGAQRQAARAAMDRLNVKPAQPDLTIGALSGGNQQKVLMGRVLATEPKVLVLEEPTSGVDIGAKAEIHHIIDGLVAQGCAVLLISSDLPELVGMSDRTLVMRQGRIVGEFGRGADHEEVMALAFQSSTTEA